MWTVTFVGNTKCDYNNNWNPDTALRSRGIPGNINKVRSSLSMLNYYSKTINYE